MPWTGTITRPNGKSDPFGVVTMPPDERENAIGVTPRSVQETLFDAGWAVVAASWRLNEDGETPEIVTSSTFRCAVGVAIVRP
jgi:hypothetical protein